MIQNLPSVRDGPHVLDWIVSEILAISQSALYSTVCCTQECTAHHPRYTSNSNICVIYKDIAQPHLLYPR